MTFIVWPLDGFPRSCVLTFLS